MTADESNEVVTVTSTECRGFQCQVGAQLLSVSLGNFVGMSGTVGKTSVTRADRFAADELLYLSSCTGTPRRGGVPVLFPQFANDGPLLKHGFARNCTWGLVHARATEDVISTEYVLDVPKVNQYGWPHDARLELITRIGEAGFTQELRVINTGSDAFTWTGGLHPYFLVHDYTRAGLQGFDVPETGAEPIICADRITGVKVPLVKNPGDIGTWFTQGCERLYSHAPMLDFYNGRHKMQISTYGFDQWIIWNPGQKGAAHLTDLPLDEHLRFLCIEPVIVDRPKHLAPGEVFCGGLEVARSVGGRIQMTC